EAAEARARAARAPEEAREERAEEAAEAAAAARGRERDAELLEDPRERDAGGERVDREVRRRVDDGDVAAEEVRDVDLVAVRARRHVDGHLAAREVRLDRARRLVEDP